MTFEENIKEARKFFETDSFFSQVFDESVSVYKNNPSALGVINFACNLRELLRNMMDEYAPDEQILQCPWSHNYLDENGKPTRKAKIRFYLLANMNDVDVSNIFHNSIDDYEKKYVKYINDFSKYTHFTRQSYTDLKGKEHSVFIDCIKLLCEIVEFIHASKVMTNRTIEKFLYNTILYHINSDLPNELDVLSTHTTVPDVSYVNFEIDSIVDGLINISGTADLVVNLRYGSDSDFRHDDGCEFDDRFCLDFRAQINIADLHDIKVLYDEIDTSHFYS